MAPCVCVSARFERHPGILAGGACRDRRDDVRASSSLARDGMLCSMRCCGPAACVCGQGSQRRLRLGCGGGCRTPSMAGEIVCGDVSSGVRGRSFSFEPGCESCGSAWCSSIRMGPVRRSRCGAGKVGGRIEPLRGGLAEGLCPRLAERGRSRIGEIMALGHFVWGCPVCAETQR